MATEEGEDGWRAERVGLKRKLTGPPRLLLGKTKTKNLMENRPAVQTKRNETETSRDLTGTDSSHRRSDGEEEQQPAGAALGDLTETLKMDEEVSRGRSGAEGEDTGKDDEGGNRKTNKRGWWRIFSPAVVCVGRRKKDPEKCSAERQTDSSALPEGALQGNELADAEKVTKRKRRFKVWMWPTFGIFSTLSDAQRPKRRRRVAEEDGQKPSPSFRKKLQRLLSRGRRELPPSLAQENMEDNGNESVSAKQSDTRCSSIAQTDDLPKDLSVSGQSPEVVTVTAEMSVQLPEERAAETETTCEDESPNFASTGKRHTSEIQIIEEEMMDAAGQSETIQTGSSAKTEGEVSCATDKDVTARSEVADIIANTKEIHTDDVNKVAPSEKEEVTESAAESQDSVRVAVDASDQLSVRIVLPEEASDAPTTETTSHADRLLVDAAADGLAILPNSLSGNSRAELDLPDPDGAVQDDGWAASSSAENHHDHDWLFPPSCGPTDARLLQTARSLVRAAMSAAVEQLTREQQSVSTAVLREPQGCRDHA